MVLPTDRDLTVPVIVHELGHVLDYQLGFTIDCRPVTGYARTDRREAFAETFAAWVLPIGYGYGYGEAKGRLYAEDRRTVHSLGDLAGRKP